MSECVGAHSSWKNQYTFKLNIIELFENGNILWKWTQIIAAVAARTRMMETRTRLCEQTDIRTHAYTYAHKHQCVVPIKLERQELNTTLRCVLLLFCHLLLLLLLLDVADNNPRAMSFGWQQQKRSEVVVVNLYVAAIMIEYPAPLSSNGCWLTRAFLNENWLN